MRDAENRSFCSITWLTITAIGVGLVTVSATQIVSKRLVWNASSSVPTGLYWIANGAPKRGDIVLVELPEPFRTIADQRGYLPKTLPALKRVRALSVDQVCRIGRTVLINGEAVVVAQSHDIHGLKLSEWSGCRTLKRDDIFLLTDHPKSFDGRYFGPIDRSAITGIAHPLWTD